MKAIEDYIEKEVNRMSRGMVATPTKKYLDDFSRANNGSNDFLLMQMSIQYGYKMAMEKIKDKIKEE